LAGPSAGQHVDGFHGLPVDAGDVAVVRNPVSVAEDPGGGFVDFADPCEFGVGEHLGESLFEAADAGEQGTDLHAAAWFCVSAM
jgi:hypothetical protein